MFGLGGPKKYRSNLWPFSPTKACDLPTCLDFSKSPYFSDLDFVSLLTPHVPSLLPYDSHLPPVEKIVWFYEFKFLPRNSYLEHGLGYKFEQTLTNSVYALIYRVLAVPEVVFPASIDFPDDWFSLPPLNFAYRAHELEWLENLKPHQKHRCTKAYGELQQSINWPRSLDVFPKCDELLLAKSKPRIIWNVPPILQAFLGPLFRQVTLHMKEHFDGRKVYLSGGKKFTLFFACGVESSDLSNWANYSVAMLRAGVIDWAGIFLGDDTLVLYIQDGVIKSMENDFSAYDSTQRDAAQKRLVHFYKKIGIPDLYCSACLHISNMKLRVRYGDKKQFSFKIKLPSMQTATGKPDTCVGNSIMNMDATVQFMCSRASYEDYGFVAKQSFHNKWTDGSFLKGFWCLNQEGWYSWNALPSCLIKLLKTFTYKGESLRSLLCKNLSSVGLSQTPIVSALIRHFGVTGVQNPNLVRVFGNESVPLSISPLIEFLENRYSVPITWFISLQDLLLRADLGSNVSHPLWSVLASVDHGDGDGLLENCIA